MPALVVYLQYKNMNPISFFGLLAIIALVIIQKLPETFGEEMHDHIEEAERFHKEKLIELEEIP